WVPSRVRGRPLSPLPCGIACAPGSREPRRLGVSAQVSLKRGSPALALQPPGADNASHEHFTTCRGLSMRGLSWLSTAWKRWLLPSIMAIVACASAVDAQQAPRPNTQPPEEVLQLPEITVKAPARLPEPSLRLSEVPATVQIITGDELRQSGAVNLQEVLTRLPGVTLHDEQGNAAQPGVTLRGFEATSVTGVPQGISVFLDGVRLNEPTVEEINFDLIPLDDIERIELIRGPTAIFGRNTLAGSLNIVTARGAAEREIVPEVAGGSFGAQKYRLRLSGAEGRIDYYASRSFARPDGWREMSATPVGGGFAAAGVRSRGTDA